MVRDPVCSAEVDEGTAAATSVYQGQIYYFCSPDCKEAFDSAPDGYVSAPDESMMRSTDS